jgi:hypothetical protein
MTDRHYINVGTLAQYWRTLLDRADNDEDAWEQLCSQMSKGYLACDPPVTADRLCEPSLRYGGRSVSQATPRLQVRTDDGVLLDADYFRAGLAPAKPASPPLQLPAPAQIVEVAPTTEVAEMSPQSEKARDDANKRRTNPATMTKAERDAARYQDKLTLLKEALSDGKKRTNAELARKIDVPLATFKRWGMNQLKTVDDVSHHQSTL